jgi:SET domain
MFKLALASLLVLQATTADTTCPAGSNAPTCTKKPRLECGTYMAPSTLGEDTNMGIYTGTPLAKDDKVNFPEIAIPLLFREWGSHTEGYDDGVLWDRYIWEGPVANLEPYDDKNREDSRAVFVPGIGCTVNSILDMRNIESTHGSVYDTAGLHRSKDPGSGAFCPYHSSETTVVVPKIAAGAELFAAYGDYWIPQIPGAQITFDSVMDRADEFLKNELYGFTQSNEMSDELKESLFRFTKNFPSEPQTFSVLPRGYTYKQVEEAIRDEGGFEEKGSVVRQFIRKQSIRSLDWLDEHGYCQDHIKPDRSTIEQAGRGAFASRNLPKGTVVGYSPLIHMGVHGREIFKIDYEAEKRSQYDLVYNYAFGHKNSSLLLIPYGGMVNYINHDRERANVKVRWPSKELIAHKPDWLNKDVHFLRDTLEKIGLSFEYVALRDIAEGEEVFMDYGPEWEQAWEDYVKNWQPPPDADQYVHTSQWNETHIRTVYEQSSDPYPTNFITMCEVSYGTDDEGNSFWLPVMRPDSSRVYCNIVEREIDEESGNFTYKVEMEVEDDEWLMVTDVPQENVYLYDAAYTADWHLPGFRHPIAIPDDVMPSSWMNGPPVDPFEEDETDSESEGQGEGDVEGEDEEEIESETE